MHLLLPRELACDNLRKRKGGTNTVASYFTPIGLVHFLAQRFSAREADSHLRFNAGHRCSPA